MDETLSKALQRICKETETLLRKDSMHYYEE